RSTADNHTTFGARRAWDVRCTHTDLPTRLLSAVDIATQSGNAVERQHRFTTDKRRVPVRAVRPTIFAKVLGGAIILQLLEEVQPVHPRFVIKDEPSSPGVAAIIRGGKESPLGGQLLLENPAIQGKTRSILGHLTTGILLSELLGGVNDFVVCPDGLGRVKPGFLEGVCI